MLALQLKILHLLNYVLFLANIYSLNVSRDVMSIAKKLAKERDEMCRELRRLHDSTIELHDNMIMELQVLKEENNSLRRKDAKEDDIK